MFVSTAVAGHGEQEKGQKWPETLSSVEVLKVNGVPVKLTPMSPPPLQVKREGYVMGCVDIHLIDGGFQRCCPYLLFTFLNATSCILFIVTL